MLATTHDIERFGVVARNQGTPREVGLGPGAAVLADGGSATGIIASGKFRAGWFQGNVRIDGVCTGGCVTRPVYSQKVVDATNEVGLRASITIGADDRGIVAYHDSTNMDLRVGHCRDIACTGFDATSIDTAGDISDYAAVTIGSDGLALIAYYDSSKRNLKTAHCSGIACSSASTATIDSEGGVGSDVAATLGSDDRVLIAYRDLSADMLKIAHCSNLLCTSAVKTSLAQSVAFGGGRRVSITIGLDGLGLVSFYNAGTVKLRAAHCSNFFCSAATTTTIDSAGDVGLWSSITVGPEGQPAISYQDVDKGDLKVARCLDPACTSVRITVPDSAGVVSACRSSVAGSRAPRSR